MTSTMAHVMNEENAVAPPLSNVFEKLQEDLDTSDDGDDDDDDDDCTEDEEEEDEEDGVLSEDPKSVDTEEDDDSFFDPALDVNEVGGEGATDDEEQNGGTGAATGSATGTATGTAPTAGETPPPSSSARSIDPLSASLSSSARGRRSSLRPRRSYRRRESALLLLSDPVFAAREKLTWEHVELGSLLGKGAFNLVHEVTVMASPKVRTSLEIGEEDRYAMKHVRESLHKWEKDLDTGATSLHDLVMEAKILAGLHHENVITLHAVGGGERGAFLLLDRLTGTLESKLRQWKKEEKAVGSFFRSPGRNSVRQMIRLETVALPIAEAMKYLHSESVLFRDLKPDNVGYGYDGKIKLFDFGLARPLLDPAVDGVVGLAGTPRYMSPECYGMEEYGLPADVYSFGMILWEIMTLKKPFHKRASETLADHVKEGGRPKLSNRSFGPPAVRALIQGCWDQDPAKRPTFEDIATIIPSILENSNSCGGGGKNFSNDGADQGGEDLLPSGGGKHYTKLLRRGTASDIKRSPVGRVGLLKRYLTT